MWKAISALCVAGLLAACSSSDASDPGVAKSVAPLEEPDDATVDQSPSEAESDDGEESSGDGDDDRAESDDEGSAAGGEEEDFLYATEDATVLFDPSVVHTFDINLAPEALAELDAEPAAEEYVEGSLTFNGETLESVGVRYKGSVGAFVGCTDGPNPFSPSGPKTCTKLSLKLRINWNGADTEFYGQRRVQLHAMNLDESLLRERLGYEMFRSVGVAAPRSTHARVNVNGEFVGLFALVEQVDGRFTRDRFDDGTGNLYKEVWPFDQSGAVTSSEALIDGLETNEDDEDLSVEIIQSFAQQLLDANAANDPDAARQVLGERTDLDTLISYAVVDRAINHDDGPFHWYCDGGPCEPHNFYLYEDPSSQQVHIIAWDLDNAWRTNGIVYEAVGIADGWGETSNDCEPFPFGQFNFMQVSAACDPFVAAWSSLDAEFAAADAAFRSGPFAPDNVRSLIDEWSAQIEPIVAEASAAHADAPTVEEWRAGVDALINDFVAPAEQES